MSPILQIDDLRVSFSTRRGVVEALRGVSLTLEKGATLGLVGESGSGKSVTAYAATRLLDRAGRVTAGQILFRGRDITRANARELREIRGASMSMIFQNPRAALNPIRSVGDQICDVLRAHMHQSKSEARAKAQDLLDAVLIRDAHRRLDSYPHELSGGMCQRIMIAMAIACEPDVLIADEPTTGLDVTTQKTVMDLISRITSERGMAAVLITHDLGLAAQYCENIAVMEQGRIVEQGETAALFRSPNHHYTKRLIAASPTPDSTVQDLARAAADVQDAAVVEVARSRPCPAAGPALLEVQNLTKVYERGGMPVVDDVSFLIPRGGSLGLVGESGSGKTTISRIICRLIDTSAGKILFDGQSIGDISANAFHHSALRRDIQIVFQDPSESLNPRFSAFDSIAHPLRTLERLGSGQALRSRVVEAAERSGLHANLLTRYSHQLSGGQKARVGIARAIALRPRLLVLDEPTAALDVSIQAVILDLLDRLRRQGDMAFLFVSHDLNVVRMMCDQVVVLRSGKIVEEGSGEELFRRPKTAYTQELLAAIPHFRPLAA
jgi:peptide/nickel transport system ATP-binding protein